jgi:hypothetical protein
MTVPKFCGVSRTFRESEGAMHFRSRVQIRSSGSVAYTLPQQVELGAALHLTLDQFQPVHLALRLPVAPRQSERGPDRSQVLAQALGETAPLALIRLGQPSI